MLKRFFLFLISFYQRYISALFGPKCRYYPSCSEYSKQVFEFQNPIVAFLKTFLRVLSCNQFFKGGISYPKIHKVIHYSFMPPKTPKYWLIPTKVKNFTFKNLPYVARDSIQNVYIIKNFSKVSRAQ